jgi:hypothetical protein
MSTLLEPVSLDLPVIDLDLFLSQTKDSQASLQECKKAS